MIDPTSLFINVISFSLALAIVVKSSEVLVRSSVAFSKKHRIPLFIIGLVVVSVGTSLPELFTGTVGSLFNKSGISIGTIIGANMLNICVLLGASIMLMPEHHKAKEWTVQGFVLIAVTLLFITFLNDGLSRAEGMLLLILFTLYVYSLFFFKKAALPKEGSFEPSSERSILARHPQALLLVSALLLGGASVWLVTAIQGISNDLGIAESVIAAFLVALGTTIPELTVTLHSIKHRAFGVLLGNIVGSNITNILLIGGLASVLRPFPAPEPAVFFMIPFFVFAPLLAMLYLTRTVPRLFGVALILLYVVFVIFAAFSIPFSLFA